DAARAGRGVAKAGVPRTQSRRGFCQLGATQPNPKKLRELLQEQKSNGSAAKGVPYRIAQGEREGQQRCDETPLKGLLPKSPAPARRRAVDSDARAGSG